MSNDAPLRLPHVDNALLEYLERIIVDKAPEPSQTDREIWINRGRVEVLRNIRQIHQHQQENMLGGTNVSEFT